MKKKPRVKVIQAGSLDELMGFLQKLEKGDSEEIEAMLEAAPEVAQEHCADPMCPTCMHATTKDTDEKANRVEACMQTLTRDELVFAATCLFGLVASIYDVTEDENLWKPLGIGIHVMKQNLRKKNEKFAFATDPGKHGEGAKH